MCIVWMKHLIRLKCVYLYWAETVCGILCGEGKYDCVCTWCKTWQKVAGWTGSCRWWCGGGRWRSGQGCCESPPVNDKQTGITLCDVFVIATCAPTGDVYYSKQRQKVMWCGFSTRRFTFPNRWEMIMSGMAWAQPVICKDIGRQTWSFLILSISNRLARLYCKLQLEANGIVVTRVYCFFSFVDECVHSRYVVWWLPFVLPSPSSPQHMGWCWSAAVPPPWLGSPAATHKNIPIKPLWKSHKVIWQGFIGHLSMVKLYVWEKLQTMIT